ncbi:TPA: fimbrial protein [Klebsiella quasipneumoniae]|uniref:fimbrial protein n=1 Tax=Klebsiella quasipneumoniae TaxID=1463165 RepID=UPI000C7A0C16|nr:fimbrial protein [Klebsiella quasipneumoniae]PLD50262.1 fimbrial protein [Klebsiella quasipneumoniae]HCI7053994.1 fimbrial protein [Klebsiella quasipneumoniae subsp. quasipneumoniae]HCT6926902.1 fimbrial protein [Klebsiella quasipneumoniae]
MNKNIIAVLIAGGLFSANVLANDGTVNFTGNITDGACTVDIQNSGTNTGNVTLGDVPKTAFSGVGSTAGNGQGLASIDIAISGCPSTKTAAYVTFDGDYYNSNSDYLRLSNYGNTGVAKGVAIKLFDGTGQHLKLGQKSPAIPLTSGAATVDFKANYVQVESDIEEGTANGTATLLVTY